MPRKMLNKHDRERIILKFDKLMQGILRILGLICLAIIRFNLIGNKGLVFGLI